MGNVRGWEDTVFEGKDMGGRYSRSGAEAAAANMVALDNRTRVESRGGELSFGVATTLTPIASTDIEVAADGREIFATVAAVQGVVRPPVVIENWPALLPPQQR